MVFSVSVEPVFYSGGMHVALGVLTDREERVPSRVAKGVRGFNVHADVFLARGARQYAELLKRCAP